MEFKKSAIELIKLRKSNRTYDERSIDNLTLQKLKDYIEKINKESKIKARFMIINNNEINGKKPIKLGTYGIISGVSTFIAGALNKDENNALEFGYLFEKIILFATDLGLQTCWLGGTFNKDDFEKNSGLNENEFISIVSPVGYKKEKARILETAMRASVGADKRKPWSELFFEKNISIPLDEKNAGLHAIPIEMVRLGPSASNKQPWRIVKDGDYFHFFLCRTKGYGHASFDMQKNDMGIAKCHFELSALELGLKGGWQDMNNADTPSGWEYVISWIPED